MDNLPFDLVGLASSEIDSLEAVYKALQDKFAIKVPDNFNIDVSQFDSIKFYQNTDRQSEATVGGVLQLDNYANNCYVVFVKIRYYYPPNASYHTGERLDYYKYLVWALVNQKNDFGRALIRKETFTDRVLSLIHPVELEFKDDKAFSNKFYIVANEPEKATNCINWNFRNALMEIDLRDLVIEIVGDDLIIGNNDWLNPDTAVYSAKIASKIAAVC